MLGHHASKNPETPEIDRNVAKPETPTVNRYTIITRKLLQNNFTGRFTLITTSNAL